MVAVPVDHKRQDQRRQAHSLDNGQQGIIAKVTHDSPIHAKTDEKRNSYKRCADE